MTVLDLDAVETSGIVRRCDNQPEVSRKVTHGVAYRWRRYWSRRQGDIYAGVGQYARRHLGERVGEEAPIVPDNDVRPPTFGLSQSHPCHRPRKVTDGIEREVFSDDRAPAIGTEPDRHAVLAPSPATLWCDPREHASIGSHHAQDRTS